MIYLAVRKNRTFPDENKEIGMPNSIDAKQVALAEAPGKVKTRFRKIQDRVNRDFEYPVELSLWVYGRSKKVRWWLLRIKTRELTEDVLAVIEEEVRTFPKEAFTFFPSFDIPKNEMSSK